MHAWRAVRPLGAKGMTNESQENSSEDTTPERLALAKASFDHIESQVAAIESKARTFLTVNSLLVGAGVVSLARGGFSSNGTVRLLAVALVLLLLGSVAAAFKSLFDVLKLRKFEGHPRGATTLENFSLEGGPTLRESLAKYYADAAEKNRTCAESMVDDLKAAFKRTTNAFWVFVLTIAVLSIGAILSGGSVDSQSVDRAGAIKRVDPANDSQPKPTSPPAPKPVEGVPIEKGQPPNKPK